MLAAISAEALRLAQLPADPLSYGSTKRPVRLDPWHTIVGVHWGGGPIVIVEMPVGLDLPSLDPPREALPFFLMPGERYQNTPDGILIPKEDYKDEWIYLPRNDVDGGPFDLDTFRLIKQPSGALDLGYITTPDWVYTYHWVVAGGLGTPPNDNTYEKFLDYLADTGQDPDYFIVQFYGDLSGLSCPAVWNGVGLGHGPISGDCGFQPGTPGGDAVAALSAGSHAEPDQGVLYIWQVYFDYEVTSRQYLINFAHTKDVGIQQFGDYNLPGFTGGANLKGYSSSTRFWIAPDGRIHAIVVNPDTGDPVIDPMTGQPQEVPPTWEADVDLNPPPTPRDGVQIAHFNGSGLVL